MAAYFIKYTYCSARAKDIRYSADCVICYEKFEKVDSESFYRKFHEEIGKTITMFEPKIESVTKL